MSLIQQCDDTKDVVDFCPAQGLYLKPIARLNISVQLPQLKKSGSKISNFEIVERLKDLIRPLNSFSLFKVVKSSLEFVRFETELKHAGELEQVVAALDTKTIKLADFHDWLKVRAAEVKSNAPTRHDWDAFFRDNKSMNEMKAGERPDTIHVEGLPTKWFVDKTSTDDSGTVASASSDGSQLPSDAMVRRAFAIFGEIRTIDIPALDSFRPRMRQVAVDGPSEEQTQQAVDSQDDVFDVFVQYKEYIGFVKAMDSLRQMRLLRCESGSCKYFAAAIRVNFDKTKHLSDASLRLRALERKRLIEEAQKADDLSRRQVEHEEMRRANEARRQEAENKLAAHQRIERARTRLQRREQREAKRRRKLGLPPLQDCKTGEDGIKESAVSTNGGDADGSGDIADRIRMEERRLRMAQRKLQSIRLLDDLFDRIQTLILADIVKVDVKQKRQKKAPKAVDGSNAIAPPPVNGTVEQQQQHQQQPQQIPDLPPPPNWQGYQHPYYPRPYGGAFRGYGRAYFNGGNQFSGAGQAQGRGLAPGGGVGRNYFGDRFQNSERDGDAGGGDRKRRTQRRDSDSYDSDSSHSDNGGRGGDHGQHMLGDGEVARQHQPCGGQRQWHGRQPYFNGRRGYWPAPNPADRQWHGSRHSPPEQQQARQLSTSMVSRIGHKQSTDGVAASADDRSVRRSRSPRVAEAKAKHDSDRSHRRSPSRRRSREKRGGNDKEAKTVDVSSSIAREARVNSSSRSVDSRHRKRSETGDVVKDKTRDDKRRHDRDRRKDETVSDDKGKRRSGDAKRRHHAESTSKLIDSDKAVGKSANTSSTVHKDDHGNNSKRTEADRHRKARLNDSGTKRSDVDDKQAKDRRHNSNSGTTQMDAERKRKQDTTIAAKSDKRDRHKDVRQDTTDRHHSRPSESEIKSNSAKSPLKRKQPSSEVDRDRRVLYMDVEPQQQQQSKRKKKKQVADKSDEDSNGDLRERLAQLKQQAGRNNDDEYEEITLATQQDHRRRHRHQQPNNGKSDVRTMLDALRQQKKLNEDKADRKTSSVVSEVRVTSQQRTNLSSSQSNSDVECGDADAADNSSSNAQLKRQLLNRLVDRATRAHKRERHKSTAAKV